MAWCDADAVRLRVPQATVAKYPDFVEWIARAQNTLTMKLTGMFGAAQITSWASTCPPAMADICADLAAAFVLSDWHGEAQMAEGSPGAELKKRALEGLADILEGRATLVDSAGAPVALDTSLSSGYITDRTHRLAESTTRFREPTFTVGKRTQDESLPGSMDGF